MSTIVRWRSLINGTTVRNSLFISLIASVHLFTDYPRSRIICRAFQGIGASGAFSISLTIFYEFIPPAKYPLYGALMSTLSAVGALGGPLLGGAIDNNSTWRWIFLLK